MKFLSYLQMLAYKQKQKTKKNKKTKKKTKQNKNKNKKQKTKTKTKTKGKKKKKIKTNMVQLHKAFSEFTQHPNRQGSPVTQSPPNPP